MSVVPDQLEYEELALSGYARTCWDEIAEAAKQQAADDEVSDDAQIARDALALMYRLAEGGNS